MIAPLKDELTFVWTPHKIQGRFIVDSRESAICSLSRLGVDIAMGGNLSVWWLGLGVWYSTPMQMASQMADIYTTGPWKVTSVETALSPWLVSHHQEHSNHNNTAIPHCSESIWPVFECMWGQTEKWIVLFEDNHLLCGLPPFLEVQVMMGWSSPCLFFPGDENVIPLSASSMIF